jgi:hypothetical protein
MGRTYPEIASYIPNVTGARIIRNAEHMVSYVLTRNAAWDSVSQRAWYWKQRKTEECGAKAPAQEQPMVFSGSSGFSGTATGSA